MQDWHPAMQKETAYATWQYPAKNIPANSSTGRKIVCPMQGRKTGAGCFWACQISRRAEEPLPGLLKGYFMQTPGKGWTRELQSPVCFEKLTSCRFSAVFLPCVCYVWLEEGCYRILGGFQPALRFGIVVLFP